MTASSTTNEREPVVICERLVQIYRTASAEVQALRGVDLTVTAGEAVALIGASGSGKSTLLNVLGGLVKPSAGTAIVAGLDIGAASKADLDTHRKRHVGFVWQQTARNLLAHEKAVDNVAMVASIAGVADPANAAHHLLDEVNIAHRASHRVGELSGGEQQRVAIAVALANNPLLLLADEPTGELDERTRDEIYDVLAQLRETRNLAVVIASHDVDVGNNVDRVITMRDGSAASEQRSSASRLNDDGTEVLMVDSAHRVTLPAGLAAEVGITDRAEVRRVGDELRLRAINVDHRAEQHDSGVDDDTSTTDTDRPSDG